ncbi:MAG: TIGR02300 family protein [Methylobacteriaceae bacterium]|nr:TIGR02300 family protein [Methylobacteriaceae bacterium]
MAKPELGLKRQCQNCGAKFFDLNKSPIVCPKCATVFVAAPTRAAARPAAAADDDEPAAAPATAEIVPLEEADGPAEKAVEGAEDDIDIDDEAGEDDAFLEEEEEEDDDVSDLIDGDIESDEES